MNQLRERVVAAAQTTALALLACIITVGLVGCASSSGGSGSSGGGTLAAGGASSVYALQQPTSTSSSVLQFAAGANGSVSPQATIPGPSNFYVQALAVDSTGQVYAGGYTNSTGQGEVVVMTSSGAVSRTILLGTVGTYILPISMSVDSSGSLYVLEAGVVYVYSSSANGAATPARMITGSLTGLTGTNPDGGGNRQQRQPLYFDREQHPDHRNDPGVRCQRQWKHRAAADDHRGHERVLLWRGCRWKWQRLCL